MHDKEPLSFGANVGWWAVLGYPLPTILSRDTQRIFDKTNCMCPLTVKGTPLTPPESEFDVG